jgi:hypothetical protein
MEVPYSDQWYIQKRIANIILNVERLMFFPKRGKQAKLFPLITPTLLNIIVVVLDYAVSKTRERKKRSTDCNQV